MSKLLGLYFHWGKPASITIETSAVCNLKCLGCSRNEKSDIPFINVNIAKKIISDTYKYALNITLHFRGEPFLNKKILEIISYATDKNIFTTLSTNAYFIDEYLAESIVDSGLSNIIISMDGATQETYSFYRQGGHIDKVISALKYIHNCKSLRKSKTPYVTVQFIVNSINEKEIENAKKIAYENYADKFVVKTMFMEELDEFAKKILPKNIHYSRYLINQKGEILLKKKVKNNCRRSWESVVVCTNGNVVPCCFDKKEKYVVGNINNDTIFQIFKNDRIKKFRKHILKNRKSIDICNNCSEGQKVYV